MSSPGGHAGDIPKEAAKAEILPPHGGLSLDTQGKIYEERPPIAHHLSAPAFQSPLRQHRRQPSFHREVKETLDARSEYTNNEDDGKAEHHINQYIIKDEIGRGSFGAVHLAVDQYGKEYAVKEFSKARLRKRAQSNILRRPHAARGPGHLSAGLGFNSPLHRHSASDIHNGQERGNPLYLIKEEIAIMKKLNHPNLVTLIEVLDDPEEDSLYMVLEMCKKGVVMKVGLGEEADQYDLENCRYWFRDLILGIEYLHAQGVVHRDIKPDNLLLTEDNVLKIVDFGVSEMFEKQSEMLTAKSTGSPAFLPPELCISKHGDVSGKAADIWSMGVSLYCLRYGKLPFECFHVLDLYESIKNDPLVLDLDDDPEFCDLLRKLLEKDPKKRITMAEVRDHPWVTKSGTDLLLSAEENTADLVEPPSESEVNHAITGRMKNLLTIMKAVKKFKGLLSRPGTPHGLPAALERGLYKFSASEPAIHKETSFDVHGRMHVETALANEHVHNNFTPSDANAPSPIGTRVESPVPVVDEHKASSHGGPLGGLVQRRILSNESRSSSGHDPRRGDSTTSIGSTGSKGHAHDPLDEEPLFLGVGAGENNHIDSPQGNLVAESPTAADFNIYDTAYQKEVERIRASQGHEVKVYLTRRVDGKLQHKADGNTADASTGAQVSGTSKGFQGLLDRVREKGQESDQANYTTSKTTLADIPSIATSHLKTAGTALHNKVDVAIDSLGQK